MNDAPHTWDLILAALFWCGAACVIYAYLGYPLVIAACSRLFGRANDPPEVDDAALPRIALLIIAHNEADVIDARIANALALRYPQDRLEIVVASDGSDDQTPEICRRYEGRTRSLIFPARRGKPATINASVPMLDADILVLSDANTFMDSSALRRLARWFVDPRIGAVCGRLVLTDPATGRNADSVYWKYETFLKRCEGTLSALLGANGAIYAIRRGLFTPLKTGTIVDDFVIPLTARLRTGCRIVYDPEAVAREESAPHLRGEFRRRVRIGAGDWQALSTLWPLLLPRYGWTSFSFLSHKVLRWISPLCLLLAFIASALLSRRPIYLTACTIQIAFYAICGIAALAPPVGGRWKLLRVGPMFVAMNAALLVGMIRWLRGGQSGIWRRTARDATRAVPVTTPIVASELRLAGRNQRRLPDRSRFKSRPEEVRSAR